MTKMNIIHPRHHPTLIWGPEGSACKYSHIDIRSKVLINLKENMTIVVLKWGHPDLAPKWAHLGSFSRGNHVSNQIEGLEERARNTFNLNL